ncbi:putative aminopeptidase 2 [gamma proteobacterium BDW918]|jgi:aspartyl aminopeptidase|uniref:M18 family aminopeptidase n=1 Tax=Zhongshania aliphaticivorans TaxID=1470434 RepID=A0A127M4K3_9GAMM|nr:M18 family aminopeptidase [Zhongshania aliphaticivorans]AMO68116.1 aminopeptidase [Zhongshania aliphaticivorans]EIF44572.1 putative aminopeptidase 2 [gamma proteobacterium BDW918]
MSDIHGFNEDLLRFLDASPTPFHAVETMAIALRAAGFEALDERDEWQLKPGGRYFVVRNGSSLVAFSCGESNLLQRGWRMVGAHTDSPNLKVKPTPELHRHGYFQLGVEVYGGALLNPWFDRDLGLAGRVNYENSQGDMRSCLLNIARPVGLIPSLAIHLDREANNSRTVNPQKDLPVVLLQSEEKQDFRALLAEALAAQGVADVATVLDYELSFYDCQNAAIVGWNGDFIASARLDNLLSCYIGMQALLNSDAQSHTILVCNDHEEVGSQSAVGAQGPMLESVLRRIAGDEVSLQRAMANSMMISADNAHGIHPNFSDRHDANHGPLLNAGPVIKNNVNQRYATNSDTSSLFRRLCADEGMAVQSFVVRSDMACGSTVGPLTAAALGVKTLDVGVPTFAMHSIRELAGSQDAFKLTKVLAAFYGLAELGVAN